jgi:hypothetical protein
MSKEADCEAFGSDPGHMEDAEERVHVPDERADVTQI